MSKKVLLATEKPFAKVAVEGISDIFNKAGYELIKLESYKDKDDLLQAVADADAMIIRSDIVDEAVLTAARKLKIVVRAGAGYDNIDLKAATARDVVAMNTPGQNSNAVAELAFGHDALSWPAAVTAAKTAPNCAARISASTPTATSARYVARIAKGFGMDVLGLRPVCARPTG